MTYSMNKTYYRSLAKALSKDKTHPAPKKVVLKYINQTFGIKGEITNITFD